MIEPVRERDPDPAEIEHFFAIYKDLDPDRHSSVSGWRDREAALREIDQSRQRYLDAA
jgi:inorganic pyrophosphatase